MHNLTLSAQAIRSPHFRSSRRRQSRKRQANDDKLPTVEWVQAVENTNVIGRMNDDKYLSLNKDERMGRESERSNGGLQVNH